MGGMVGESLRKVPLANLAIFLSNSWQNLNGMRWDHKFHTMQHIKLSRKYLGSDDFLDDWFCQIHTCQYMHICTNGSVQILELKSPCYITYQVQSKYCMSYTDCRLQLEAWKAHCRLQLDCRLHIATLNLQHTTSLPNISAVPVPIQQRRETFTLWFHSYHAAVMNECTKSLPRTKSLALWLLIEHINIYDNMQMLAQCPISCTHLPTKKQPKRQENKREQEEENMEKCSNPLFFGLNLWYSIWTIILPASKFQIDI